jgi:hypothetical protein
VNFPGHDGCPQLGPASAVPVTGAATTENLFWISSDLHSGQATLASEELTNSSNSCPQPSHLYSYMGIDRPRYYSLADMTAPVAAPTTANR